jgi:6-phosphofructokinase 1
LAPLIVGEDYPAFKNGVPDYVRLKNQLVPQKLSKKW